MDVNRSAWVTWIHSAASPCSVWERLPWAACTRRAASVLWVASTTESKRVPSTSQPSAVRARPATRCPECSAAPWACSHCAAVSGNSVPRSVRGSSRFEPPRPLNRLSRNTRKNTSALASCAGVLSADTHRGSMNSCSRRCGRLSHSCATDQRASHRKPLSCQLAQVRSNATLSVQLQPRARATPTSASQGGGRLGSSRPLRSA